MLITVTAILDLANSDYLNMTVGNYEFLEEYV
jgi:hypothetical protein